MTTSPSSTSSIFESTSADSFTPLALAFSVICSGRLAPTMAVETLSLASTQAMASCAMLRPSPSATGTSCCTAASNFSLASHESTIRLPPLSSVAREPSGNG